MLLCSIVAVVVNSLIGRMKFVTKNNKKRRKIERIKGLRGYQQ